MALGKTLKNLTRKSDMLVTPGVMDFLRKNPEGMILNDEGTDLADETKTLILDIMQKAWVGNSDRSGRFGASSRGTCHRAQMWVYLGMPSRKIIEPETLNLFNDGKFRHLKWQVMGMQAGVFTHAEYPLTLKKYRMTSSVDALNSEQKFLFELKGDRYMARLMDGAEDPDSVVSKHMLQVHSMFLMTGWEKCSYVMEDKATNDFRERIITRDPVLIKQVKTEMEQLNEHVEYRSLPEPLEACKSKEGPYRTCPFAAPCIERWKQGNVYWPDQQGDWDS